MNVTPRTRQRFGGESGGDSGGLLDAVCCPRCRVPIDVRAADIVCSGCGQVYPRLGDIPVLLAGPEAYLASCRRQLSQLEENAARTEEDILRQLGGADVLPATRTRCRAMIEGIRGQLADVRAILEPVLPTSDPRPGRRSPPTAEVPATIEYLHYLYRDWGWPPEVNGENEEAVARLQAVLEGNPLGRTLVLGAGGCRLAYDLHRLHPEAEILVIDIDPLLFSAARAVTRGESVSVREANLEICDLAQGSRAWLLTAPEGPVDEQRFHFLLADGVEPPITPESVDTIVTPWFIDQGPADVRDFIARVHKLLRPGGRWLNLGPLLYEPDVPVVRRFGREELFDLATRGGFRVDGWRTDAAPYLVSKLNGRGRIEWMLAFAATRLEAPADDAMAGDGPPGWLLFAHMPVPMFPGQSMFWSEAPAVRMIVEAIDGRRGIEDIARLLAHEAQRPDVPEGEIRAAVRDCLAEVHPAGRRGG